MQLLQAQQPQACMLASSGSYTDNEIDVLSVCLLSGFAPFSIRQLLQYDLLEQLDKLQAVGAAATKESSLENALIKMQADWEGAAFRVVEYKDTGTFVIGGTDEIQVRKDIQGAP